jgi:uncharacterized protein (TIGR02117 family)
VAGRFRLKVFKIYLHYKQTLNSRHAEFISASLLAERWILKRVQDDVRSYRKRKHHSSIIKLLILARFFLSACSTSHEKQSDNTSGKKEIYVVNYSWHSGVILKKSDIPQHLIPEKDDFPRDEFLEIGWGNKQFYQTKKHKVFLAAKALFIPGQSTLYIDGFSRHPKQEYVGDNLVRLKLSPEKLSNLLQEIDKSFDRKGQKRATATMAGFYDAVGHYGILNTCNMWTARVLKRGGLPVSASIYSTTAKSVLSQVRPHSVTMLPE